MLPDLDGRENRTWPLLATLAQRSRSPYMGCDTMTLGRLSWVRHCRIEGLPSPSPRAPLVCTERGHSSSRRHLGERGEGTYLPQVHGVRQE